MFVNFDPAFNLFALEQEGLLDTHESRICAFINGVRQSYNPRDPHVHAAIADQVGLNLDNLTGQELARIAREIDNM